MGKKQHQKDRLFLTSKEWKEEWGGFKDKAHLPYHKLPFNCCAIAFTPFEDPVCTEDGTVFDVTNIVPYINKHHTHPVSGAPLALSDLIPLTFHKNANGDYECPILRKSFTQVRRASPFGLIDCCAVHVALCQHRASQGACSCAYHDSCKCSTLTSWRSARAATSSHTTRCSSSTSS